MKQNLHSNAARDSVEKRSMELLTMVMKQSSRWL